MSETTKPKNAGLLLGLVIVSPFISCLISMLDAWAVRLIAGWFSPWVPTFGEAFALSLIVGIMTTHRSYNPKMDTAPVSEFITGIIFSATATPLFVLVAFIGLRLGVGAW